MPLPPSNLPPQPVTPIAQLLHILVTLRRLHEETLLRRASWALATSAVGMVLLAIALAFLGLPFWGARLLYLAVAAACGAAGVALLARLWRRVPRQPTPSSQTLKATAAQTVRLAPHLGSSVPAALALWQADPHADAGSLTQAHQAATVAALQKARPTTTQQQVGALRLRPWRRACARLAVLCLVLGILAPNQRRQLAAILHHQQPVIRSANPLVGDLTLEITPPPYSHLPTRTEAPSDGTIKALRGSVVRIGGRQDGSFMRGVLQYSDGTQRPVTLGQGGTLSAEITITQNDDYTFILTDSQGMGHQDAQFFPIVVLEDTPPTVTLTAPDQDVVLKDEQTFELRWEATDDLGLTDIALVVQSADGNVLRTLALPIARRDFAHASPLNPLGPGVRQSGTLAIHARMLGLEQGPGVRVHVAAHDTAQNPEGQTGNSVERAITLFSARAHHEALMARQAEILDQLVDWLAQEITFTLGPPNPTSKPVTPPFDPLRAQVQSAAHALHTLTHLLAEDALANEAERRTLTHILQHTEHALAQLQATHRAQPDASWWHIARAWQKPQSDAYQRRRTLEQDILYLDQLLAHGRLEELRASAQDLLSAKAELQDLLAQYKESHDATTKKQIAERMAALKKQIQKMMYKMATLRPALPQEFQNAEAEQHDRMAETMARIDQALHGDDIEGMARDLEHLANMVDNVVDELAEGQVEREKKQSAPMQKKQDALAEEMKQLAQKQAALFQHSEQLTQQQLAHNAGGDEQALDQRLKEIQRWIGEAQSALGSTKSDGNVYRHDLERLRETLADAHALVAQKALQGAADTLGKAQSMTQMLQHPDPLARLRGGQNDTMLHQQQMARTAQHATHQAQELLKQLLARQSAPLPAALRQAVKDLQKSQQALSERTQNAAQAMDALAQDGPQLGQEGAQMLHQAQDAMQQAADALGASRLVEAKQQQQQAQDLLHKLRQGMEGTQAGGSGGMSMPWGTPKPQPNPTGQAPSRSDGHDDVQIPKDQAQKLPQFRKNLLEAAKQRPPLHYEQEVRRYYDELMR